MKPKPPAFQFYPDDFLGGTLHFTDAELGLYMRLLCVQWSTGGLPDENHMLSSYGKGDTKIDRIKLKFKKCADGLLRNMRLEAERKKQRKYRKSRIDNGKRGGRPKGIGKPHANHMVLETEAKKSSPSPSPSPSLVYTHPQDYPEVAVPSFEEVKAHATVIGLAEWRARDWFNEMEGCGWRDYRNRPVQKWQALLSNVKTKWESDGRPSSPPQARNGAGFKPGQPSGPTLLEREVERMHKQAMREAKS